MAAARLGVATRIVSALADGACARLRAEGVRITNLKKRDEMHAITAALSTSEDRAFATFDGVNTILGPRIVSALGRVEARILHAALCPRDIGPLVKAVRSLRERGVRISIDVGYDFDLARDRDLPLLMAEMDSPLSSGGGTRGTPSSSSAPGAVAGSRGSSSPLGRVGLVRLQAQDDCE